MTLQLGLHLADRKVPLMGVIEHMNTDKQILNVCAHSIFSPST
jgi:hypothetical protein